MFQRSELLQPLLLLSTQKHLIYFTTGKLLVSPPPLHRLYQGLLPCGARGTPCTPTPRWIQLARHQGEGREGESGGEGASCEHQGPSELQQLQQLQQLQPPPHAPPCGISDEAVRGATGGAPQPDCAVARHLGIVVLLYAWQLRWDSEHCLPLPERAEAALPPPPPPHRSTPDHLLLIEGRARE